MASCSIECHFPDASEFVDHRIDPAPRVQQISPETMSMVEYDLSDLLPERIYADQLGEDENCCDYGEHQRDRIWPCGCVPRPRLRCHYQWSFPDEPG
jgi:hypothetical protein